ncbi:MAG TPA: hypothetical protein VHE57_13365 [Mycobacteriales bacterium]|nr:hypothetical protein [Mycobacteriales bacterium]
MTTLIDDRIVLRQKTSNILALPILIAVCLVAVVIRQFFPSPSPIVLAVCGGFAVLDVLLSVYLLRNIGSTLVVTPDEITFTKKRPAPPAVIRRTPQSSLTFRAAANGPVGSQVTGYASMLHDTATGSEVYAGAFGRARVVQACESQGWTFS